MTTTMTLRLDDETKRRLDSLAGATDRTKTYLAMQAIKTFLDANEWQVQAIQEAVEEADQATPGDFVSHEEVVSWLGSWGTSDEKEPPR